MHGGQGISPAFVGIAMYFQVKPIVSDPCQQHRRIDDCARRPDGYSGEEVGDIIRVQPDATMAAKLVNARGGNGAVNPHTLPD